MTRWTGTGAQRWRAWLGAGAVCAAVAGAMIGGAAVAAAETDSPSGGGAPASSSSESSPQSAAGDHARDDAPDDRDATSDRADSAGSATDGADAADDPDSTSVSVDDDLGPRHHNSGKRGSKAEESAAASADDTEDDSDSGLTAVEPEHPSQHPASARSQQTRRPPADDPDTAAAAVAKVSQPRAETSTVTLAEPPTESAATAQTRRPATLLELVSAVVFNTITTVERLVTGPPLLPSNSRVTVRSSTLHIADGVTVPADWYYPEGDQPPERMIVLQHGFFAIGPMYSYTAAALAERTGSIVVAPTLTSNPLAQGGMWLGGDGMHRAVADLFVGDREALTASAVAAGYAERYGLDPDTAALPEKFALAGHSLGGGLVSGTAGYLVDNGAAADLVGVILLDGVPRDGQLSTALAKLDTYEQATGHFIPVREIGAPWNLWNSTSHVNSELPQARPGRYVGVVMRGGVHMDAMRGGNPLIQLAAYLAAGFPQPQNPPAVLDLSIGWLDDWFAGRTDVGDELAPGSTIVIPTPQGPAYGVVIGRAAAPAVVAGRSPALAA